jgi:uncharacterized membrane protein YgdD (TMEM256/DUF423 family)
VQRNFKARTHVLRELLTCVKHIFGVQLGTNMSWEQLGELVHISTDFLRESTSVLLGAIGSVVPKPKPDSVEPIVSKVIVEMLPTSTTAMFVRLAGVSGALALSLGAYGAHGEREPFTHYNASTAGLHGREDISARQKQSFDTANRLHLVHSAVLLAAGNFHYPRVSGRRAAARA